MLSLQPNGWQPKKRKYANVRPWLQELLRQQPELHYDFQEVAEACRKPVELAARKVVAVKPVVLRGRRKGLVLARMSGRPALARASLFVPGKALGPADMLAHDTGVPSPIGGPGWPARGTSGGAPTALDCVCPGSAPPSPPARLSSSPHISLAIVCFVIGRVAYFSHSRGASVQTSDRSAAAVACVIWKA